MNCLPELAWLIPALPLAAAPGIALADLVQENRNDAAERFPARLALAAAGLGLAGLLVLDTLALLRPDLLELPRQVVVGRWLTIGGAGLDVSLTLDALALSFATLFAFLGFLALAFSVRYMHREAGFARYLAGLSLFVGAMLTIALAGSAWLAFVGWEFAGVASFLLVGYARQRPAATGNALFVFLNNRIGDAGFLMAIGFSLLWIGSLEWPALLAGARRLDALAGGLIGLGFLGAAAVKSGQLPFSPWLPRALDGPTPSSGVFYGCLTLHVGVFLLLRLEPLLRHTPELLALVAVAGALTTLYAWLVGAVQSDVKTSLVYGALAQVGLMFVACGLGFFAFAGVHLAAHASFRLWQFLSAPSFLHAAPVAAGRPRPLPAWLAASPRLHAAARSGFGLEHLGEALLTWPTARLGRDMATIDARIVEPAIGLPLEAGAPLQPGGHPTRGLAGLAVEALGRRLEAFEAHLLIRQKGGAGARLLERAGHLLTRIEALLEQPRYLFLFIMATLVVIL